MGRVSVLPRPDIVDKEDVDPGQAQPLQTVLERAHDAVIGIVVDGFEWHRRVVRLRRPEARAQETPDLCRQHPVVARHVAHGVADAALGLAEAVIGRGIDIARAGRPAGTDDGFRLLDGDPGALGAEGGGAETEGGHLEPGPPDPAGCKKSRFDPCVHISRSVPMKSSSAFYAEPRRFIRYHFAMPAVMVPFAEPTVSRLRTVGLRDRFTL